MFFDNKKKFVKHLHQSELGSGRNFDEKRMNNTVVETLMTTNDTVVESIGNTKLGLFW